MYLAVALEDEEKLDKRHETVFMLSLFKTISNSWVKRTVLLAFTFFLTFNINTTFAGQSVRRWWNNNWNYRINLTVDVGSYEQTEKPVEQYLNLTALLRYTGHNGTVIEDSLRVVEINSNGDVIDDRVPFQYDAMTDTWGNLLFILTGTTSAGTSRYYDVYFDTSGTFEPASVGPQVQLTDDVMDEGQASYRIVTNVRIGFSSDGTDSFFEGSIDSVRVYERALSGTEIRDMLRGVLIYANDSGS